LREADAGLVVPCDAQEVSRAIATLVSAPDLRRRMGEVGRQLVKAKFSWTESGRQLVALYEQTVISPAGSAVAAGPAESDCGVEGGNMNRRCPLCGGRESARYDRASSLGLYRCSACSLIYIAQAAEIETRYEDAEHEYFGEGYLRKRDLFANWF